MKNKIIVIISIMWGCSCSPYKPYSSQLDSNIMNCKNLEEFVSENWSRHKSKQLYKYKDKSKFVDGINSTFKSCFFDLSFEQVKQLLGEPNTEVGSNDELIYHVSKECELNSTKCEVLLISFDNDKLTPVYISIQRF